MTARLPRSSLSTSAATTDSYLRVGRALCEFLVTNGLPECARDIPRDHVETYLAAMFERKVQNRKGTVRPATVAKHFRSLQQLFRWLVDDGEIEGSPMERMRPPAVPEQPVPIVIDAHIEALLAPCKANTFQNRRDLAIIRLFLDTGMRAGELAGLRVNDVDQEEATAHVLGKGGRHRACPYGARTADALRRYIRARRAHRYASDLMRLAGWRGGRWWAATEPVPPTNGLAPSIAGEPSVIGCRSALPCGGMTANSGGSQPTPPQRVLRARLAAHAELGQHG